MAKCRKNESGFRNLFRKADYNDMATRVARPYRSVFSEAIHCLKKCLAWKGQSDLYGPK